ncbi:MAG: sterol desaturase family protein [Actinomycetota bacterium]|nr:sterol desaturase family protein [Actinomycetota bacterium]
MLLSLAILASISYGAYAWFTEGGSPWAPGELTGVWSSWLGVILDPWFTAFLVGMAILQWKFPADPSVHLRSPGVAQDLFWYMWGPIRDVTIIAASLTALGFALDQITHAELNLVPAMGVGGVAVLAFVVGDFAAWASHIMHHRFPLLWEFHKVHHSQREMSFMTDNREHFVETIISAAVVFVPAKLLGLETEAAGALAFLSNYLQTLSHANIKTNLGPLRFILVSPQYHRVHHSILREHYNINYGSVLSVWDYIFRTFFPDKDSYPPTGINDETFPLEHSLNPVSLAHTWWQQTLFPFRTHFARWRQRGAIADTQAQASRRLHPAVPQPTSRHAPPAVAFASGLADAPVSASAPIEVRGYPTWAPVEHKQAVPVTGVGRLRRLLRVLQGLSGRRRGSTILYGLIRCSGAASRRCLFAIARKALRTVVGTMPTQPRRGSPIALHQLLRVVHPALMSSVLSPSSWPSRRAERGRTLQAPRGSGGARA